VSVLVLVLTSIVFIVQRDNQYDKRMSMIENAQAIQRERDAQQDRDVAQTVDIVRRQLDRIEDKLERAITRDMQLNGRIK
jgi:Ethanolamine utilization protein EutJ (predicted chaperonin)